jgi:SAM-dependent methyltransferase
MSSLACRFCGTRLEHTFADLGVTPVANHYLTEEELSTPERFFSLQAHLCHNCLLVQLNPILPPGELFSDYSYFSSYSVSYLDHARSYANDMIDRFGLDPGNLVVEVASNDGYLLQYFKERGVRVLGVEPAGNVAKEAQAKGIPTVVRFFGTDTARELVAEGNQADLIVGNNVLAHVPIIEDFVRGLRILLKDKGIITLEFPHLLNLVEQNQFDTIYHEHYSYLSFLCVERIFRSQELVLFDVEELSTHGGSLRIYGRHAAFEDCQVTERVRRMKTKERSGGIDRIDFYAQFSERIKETKRKLLDLLIALKRGGKSIAAYGAPAKGNTLLNYCGIRSDFIDYTVDRSPHKQGRYLPGTRIPIFAPDRVRETRPDYLLILPWNLRDEISEQMSDIRSWGGKFLLPIPEPEVF